MQPRQTLTEKFSTFVRFADDRFDGWIVDPALRRSIGNCTDHDSGTRADEFWALYWYQHWKIEPSLLSVGHLSAYLQETCYWTVQKITVQSISTSDRLSDYFQIAIATLPKILNGYSSGQGVSLKTYSSVSFGNTIRNRLRQQQDMNHRTDWGLLRKLSQKRLLEVLQASGLAERAIAAHLLAWKCFKTCWVPDETPMTRQLACPTASAWSAIADLYEQQNTHQSIPIASATSEELEQWLKFCATEVRKSLRPTVISLNVAKFEPGSAELQDDLVDRDGTTPLMDLIAEEEIQEQQRQSAQVQAVLTDALELLDPELRSVLELYYHQDLTQKQIATQLNLKQSTISRRLSGSKEKLLKKLVEWSQETLHTSLTSPVIGQMSFALEEWLQTHYQSVAPSP